MTRQIHTVAVVGCGVIGMSWAALFLAKGLRVIITDPAEGAEKRFEQYLRDAWTLLNPNNLESSKNYEFVADIVPKLPEADFVQENGPENIDFKTDLFKTLDQHVRHGVVIASSSSGLPSSTFIGKCENEPDRILVGHPFNPPHLIPLVEVVPHAGTSDAAKLAAVNFYRSLGKKPILINKEVPGFVANRLQAAINNEAYSLITRGVVSAEDLDVAVQSGPGLRWALTGPIVINALGGGGGPDGFNNRLNRLGTAIKGWVDDMQQHHFDWSEESIASLKAQAHTWLDKVDWPQLQSERDNVLVKLLEAKAEQARSQANEQKH